MNTAFQAPSSSSEPARGTGPGLRGLLIGLVGLLALTALGPGFSALSVLSGQKQDAAVINIAGRQRMLSQKMTKEALLLSSGGNLAENRQTLAQTRDLFDASLRGLISGDAAQKLPATEDAATLAQIKTVESLWKEFSARIQDLLSKPQDSPEFSAALDHVVKTNGTLLKEMNTAVGLYESAAQSKVNTLRIILLGGIIIALGATVLCWLVITRRILCPVRRLSEQIDALGRGDLDSRLGMTGGDELSQVGRHLDRFADNLRDEILTAFNKLAEGDFTFRAEGLIRVPLAKTNASLNETMSKLSQVAERIAMQSLQVAETSTSLSHGATEAASSLEEISTSINQMASQTSLNAENATQANNLSREAKTAAESGNDKMQDMIIAMGEINQSSRDISKIIKVIDEIAFQTNLLALNAAVEAARAGQHGKGFAVVAEEVRNLAARSAKAARETATLIEGSVHKVESGALMADQTGEALDHIVRDIAKVSNLVAEISSASSEQALGISQINIGLHQIDNVTQQNTANSEESAAAAEELSSQARELQQMLQGFKLWSNGHAATFEPTPKATRPPKRAPEQHRIALDASEFGRY